MTAFATCAYPGCYRRIPYDPKSDLTRPRYCSEHMERIDIRLGNRVTDNYNDLYIPVINPHAQPLPVLPHEPCKVIIVRCPLCKTRKEVPASKILVKIPCTTFGCDGVMIYHKDAGEPNVR